MVSNKNLLEMVQNTEKIYDNYITKNGKINSNNNATSDCDHDDTNLNTKILTTERMEQEIKRCKIEYKNMINKHNTILTNGEIQFRINYLSSLGDIESTIANNLITLNRYSMQYNMKRYNPDQTTKSVIPKENHNNKKDTKAIIDDSQQFSTSKQSQFGSVSNNNNHNLRNTFESSSFVTSFGNSLSNDASNKTNNPFYQWSGFNGNGLGFNFHNNFSQITNDSTVDSNESDGCDGSSPLHQHQNPGFSSTTTHSKHRQRVIYRGKRRL